MTGPVDILQEQNMVWESRTRSTNLFDDRYPKGTPQNIWEVAQLHVQQNKVVVDTLDPTLKVLCYCAADTLLKHRKHIPIKNRKYIEQWYVELDGHTFTPPTLTPTKTLGQWRLGHGIEYLHLYSTLAQPNDVIWNGEQYAITKCAYHIEEDHQVRRYERLSFCDTKWYIQEWLLSPYEDSETYSELQYDEHVMDLNTQIDTCLRHLLYMSTEQYTTIWKQIPKTLLIPVLINLAVRYPYYEEHIYNFLHCRHITLSYFQRILDISRQLNLESATILEQLKI